MRNMKILSSLLILFAAVRLSAQTPQFTVSGIANKLVDADEMIINVGYQAEGKNPQVIFSQTQKKMAEAIKHLNSLKGVKRIETDVIRLNRKYTSVDSYNNFSGIQTLSITLANFDLYEELMIKLMELGFNTVGGVRFAVSDMAIHKREVQLNAIAAAKEKAVVYAKALDVELGPVISFRENQIGRGSEPKYYNYRSADAGTATGPSIAPQQIEITMQVIVSYAINKTL